MLAALALIVALPQAELDRLVTPAEVAAYVTAHWESDFQRRLNGEDGRAPVPGPVVRVDHVTCVLDFGASRCAFTVTRRLADGETRSQWLSADFGRHADGTLDEVLIFTDVRLPRRR